MMYVEQKGHDAGDPVTRLDRHVGNESFIVWNWANIFAYVQQSERFFLSKKDPPK